MRGPWACAAVLAAACTTAPEPLPVRGELPRTIAVWPDVGAEFAPARDLLLTGMEQALRARGYAVVPAGVARELLHAATLDAASVTPAASGRVIAADAVLQLVPRAFVAVGAQPLHEATWDLEWRLVSARGGGTVWSCPASGSWRRAIDDGRDPHRALDAPPELVPFGGGPRNWRDAADLVAALHRQALAQLPPRPR